MESADVRIAFAGHKKQRQADIHDGIFVEPFKPEYIVVNVKYDTFKKNPVIVIKFGANHIGNFGTNQSQNGHIQYM